MVRTQKYGEPTKQINLRIPESKIDEVKSLIYSFLEGNSQNPSNNNAIQNKNIKYLKFLMDFFQKNKENINSDSISEKEMAIFQEIVELISKNE
jgi:hypothetical protein